MKMNMNFMQAVILAIATAAIALPNALGQESYSISLEQAQKIALEKAFAVQYANLDKQKSERDVKELLSTGLPQVSIVADYSQYIDIPVQVASGDVFGFPDYLTNFLGGVAQSTGVPLNAPPSDPDAISEFQFGQSHTANVGVQASQLIFSGSYLFGVKASRLLVESRERGQERTADEVMQQVAEAYHFVLAASEGLALSSEALTLIQGSRNDVAALNEAGFADELAVSQMDLAINDLEAQVLASKGQIMMAKGLLRFQMGIGPKAKLTLIDGIEDLMSNGNELEWMSRDFLASEVPGVQEQELFLGLAGLDVKSQIASGWPEVSAFYTNQSNAQRDAFDFFQKDRDWYPVQLWGVNVSMPVWTSFGGRQAVEKKRIQEERARVALNQLTQAATMAFENAQVTFSYAMTMLNNARNGERLAQKIYAQSEVRFKEGMVSSFDMDEARNQMLEAKIQRLTASLDWLDARVALQKALSAFE
jgi:outer membrane protein TolC